MTLPPPFPMTDQPSISPAPEREEAKTHMHRCLRCDQEFACETPDICRAQYHVLPTIVTRDATGAIVMREHCPEPPAKEKPAEGPVAHSTGGNGYTLSIPLAATMQQSGDVCPARGTTNGAHCDHIMPYGQSSVGVSMKCCHCGRIHTIVPATPPIPAGHGPHFPRTTYGY